jgi:hypothetical protein
MRAETRIVEQKEMAVAMKRHGKHLSMVMNAHATIQELLGHCPAMQGFLCSLSRLYNKSIMNWCNMSHPVWRQGQIPSP